MNRISALVCGFVNLANATLLADLFGTFFDFLVFHTATRAVMVGALSIVYDAAALTELQNTLQGSAFDFRPFLYPPIWLLYVIPFGLLSTTAAVVVFLALTCGFCVFALRSLNFGWISIVAILTSPAAIWVIIVGQNTFLSVALFYAGLALLHRRPTIAGILLGLLIYKPHLCMLVPLALIAARAWRPLVAMSITVAFMSVVSLVVFGSDLWLSFLETARHASIDIVATASFAQVHATLFAAAKTMGLSNDVAMAVQFAGAGIAGIIVIVVFARYRLTDESIAILLAATFLASPYLLTYDLLLLMPAATLLFLRPRHDRRHFHETAVYLSVLMIPTFGIFLNQAGLPIIPLIIGLFGATALHRLHLANDTWHRVGCPQRAAVQPLGRQVGLTQLLRLEHGDGFGEAPSGAKA